MRRRSTNGALGRIAVLVAGLAAAWVAQGLSHCAIAQTLPGAEFHAAQCEGAYSGHLQGVCTNNRDAIYWCFTSVLVKTDPKGHVERKVDVASHHGDLCYDAGKLYVAVNLGQFNRPAGHADSWVYVYDSETLAELARHKVPEVVHGAGGIARDADRFLVVGGLPGGFKENYLYEYDADFTFVKRHIVPGYTLMGIQTATFADGRWWFGCYGVPRTLLVTDGDFKLSGRWKLDVSLGIVGLPDGRLLVARGANERGKGHTAQVQPARPDAELGLRLIE